MHTLEKIKNNCRTWEESEPQQRLFTITLDGETIAEFWSRRTTVADMYERLLEIVGGKGSEVFYIADAEKGFAYWGKAPANNLNYRYAHTLEIAAV